ncbi:hypothetical protein EIN_305550, partial [Entamoeba invadens IP1]
GPLFHNCVALEELVINKSAKIETNCFVNCTSLTKLEIPNYERKVEFLVTQEDQKVIEQFNYVCTQISVCFDANNCKSKLVEFTTNPNINTKQDAFF